MDGISFNKRANFATASRLLASIINEEIVNTVFLSNNNNIPKNDFKQIKTSGGMIFVLPNFKRTNFNYENYIITVQTLNKPMTSSTQHFDKVEFVDPWDMIFPVGKIKIKENLSFQNNDVKSSMNFIFSSYDSNDSIEEISAVELMRIFGVWMNLENDISNQLIAEINSSVQYQEITYKNYKHQLSLNFSSSVEWEQSLLEGHAFHPMHKARHAISPIQEILPGSYDFMNPLIRFIEVPLDKMVIRGSYEKTIEKITKLLPSPPPSSKNTILIPVHELQIPNIESKFPFANILPEKYSIKAKSQASLRTVVIPELNDIAIKLPLGIKVTSALRTVTPWSTHSGPALGSIIDKLEIDRNLLKVCKEFAGVYSIEKDFDIAKHSTCIIREDFNELNSDGERVIICAALVERDEFGKSVVEKVWNLDTEQKRIDFFDRFVSILFKAFLPPVFVNGFSFEAHLQNVLARFDSKSGELVGFVVRDFGGIKHHQDTLFESIGERVDVLEESFTEAKDFPEVYKILYHTLILCNVHRFARALNLHYNGIGWDIVRKHFKQIVPRDHLLYKTFLEQDKFNYKCLMEMKCDGLYRDYLYIPKPNLMMYKGERIELN
ncbi:unnamed protein product [Rhizophagus irregularis]|uniref:IucC family-domain-containing protein n=3 Tax=Rhizophagus irregularis TaxID=588596 RepID=A0A2N1N648_9GLOM|nr:hypothetical protein RhiirC2_748543 [Rhizophagus irregularis]CAB4374654.1 unnamed protein product [Rhizophagus irregularis]CAB5140715.1 unnamed protein product [Rhizophagus irregularis]CAB5375484.1 unnamed protein product [Rhizophagus irregularis]